MANMLRRALLVVRSLSDQRRCIAWSHCLLAAGTLLPLLAPCAVAPSSATGLDVVLLIDNSGSMRQNDPLFLTPRAVAKFLRGLPEHTRAAILVFDQRVRLAAPLTPVTESTRRGLLEKLAIIDYRGRFTNSPAGMERAIYELRRHSQPFADKIVVFITDGIVDTGEPSRDQELARWMREGLADEAAAAGIRIFGIAFTEEADFQLIQSLTSKTGGTYFRAVSADEISSAFTRIDASLPHSDAAIARPYGLCSETHFQMPSVTVAPEPVAHHVTVPRQRPEAAPGQMFQSQQTVAQSVIEQPTHGAGQTAVTLQDGFPLLSPAPTIHMSIPELPASDAYPPTLWTIRPPAMMVILGCGLLILSALAVATLARHRKRRALNERAAVLPTPVTTRYPPPFCLLKDLSGATPQESHDITGCVTRISRAPADDSPDALTLVIRDDYIGREHAIIEFRENDYWIIDHGSVNGSFVNDERIASERLLKHGDRLRFHTYEFEIVLPQLEGEATTHLAPVACVADESDAQSSKETMEQCSMTTT